MARHTLQEKSQSVHLARVCARVPGSRLAMLQIMAVPDFVPIQWDRRTKHSARILVALCFATFGQAVAETTDDRDHR